MQSFIFEEESGEISYDKNVVRVTRRNGDCGRDGIHEEGMLWIAQWGGFGLYRWNPNNGRLIQKIDLPVPQVTSYCFVGENLDI